MVSFGNKRRIVVANINHFRNLLESFRIYLDNNHSEDENLKAKYDRILDLYEQLFDNELGFNKRNIKYKEIA